MNEITIASTVDDARAAEAVEEHHAQMAGALTLKVEALTALARGGGADELTPLRDDLVAWCRDELMPHAQAEEDTLYRAAAARPEARLLVEAMVSEHGAIGQLLETLAAAQDPVGAAVAAGSLRSVFDVHLRKENEQVLPLLVAAPDVSVADLLAGMHTLVGDSADAPHGAEDGHACGCGEVEEPQYPELDARAIPHAIRHATVFGALDGVRTGKGLVLVAPHDPLPLLAQLERRSPGAFAVDYLERGPEAWRLRLVRQAG